MKPDIAIYNFSVPGINFDLLKESIDWRQESYGKHLQPRLTAFFGDAAYNYSGITNKPTPMTDELKRIRDIIDPRFNTVLLNYYRDGNDTIGFHSDDEPELGPNPIIASVSFGSPRRLIFKHKQKEHPNFTIILANDTLLIMKGNTQEDWVHGIIKEPCAGPRINLTFRKIFPK